MDASANIALGDCLFSPLIIYHSNALSCCAISQLPFVWWNWLLGCRNLIDQFNLVFTEMIVAICHVCRKHGISNATFYKWKAKYGGLDVSEARRLKVLEDQNAKLKKLLAEAMLDNAMLKDLTTKKF